MLFSHPSLPYTLDANLESGTVVRYRDGVAEEGTPTDLLVVALWQDMQQIQKQMKLLSAEIAKATKQKKADKPDPPPSNAE